LKRFILIVVVLLLAACRGRPTPTPEPAVLDDADLVITRASVDMEGHTPGQCVEEYGALKTSFCVGNDGQTDAQNVVVSDGNTEVVIPELRAGEEACRELTDLSGVELAVDPNNTIPEENEDDNTYLVPQPTPPLLCSMATEMAGGSLPDLYISSSSFTMEGHTPGQCVDEYGRLIVRICVTNEGDTPVENVLVTDGFNEAAIDSIGAGEEFCVEDSGLSVSSIEVDPVNDIAEADESNNQILMAVPTPPPLCVDFPTPTPRADIDTPSVSGTDPRYLGPPLTAPPGTGG